MAAKSQSSVDDVQSPADEYELSAPPETNYEYENKISLKSQRIDPARQSAVRIVLPRDPEQLEALPGDIRGALVKIIDEVAGEVNTSQIEVLMYNGSFGLEVILAPSPATVDGRSMQTTLSDFLKQLHSPVIGRTVDACKRHLPAPVGIEVGLLDLSPVGRTDVTTTRLLIDESDQLTESGKTAESPLARTLTTYQKGRIPFIYQVILEKTDTTDYNISARMATYRPEHTYTGTKGFAKLAEEGHPLDFTNAFTAYNAQSNHDLGDGYWQTTYNEGVAGATFEARYDYRYANRYTKRIEIRERADRIKQLVLGKPEHAGLFKGNSSEDPVYEECGYRGWINATPAQLQPFVELVPIQFRTNPWLAVDGRSHPEFTTRRIVREVDQDVQSVGEGTVYVPDSVSDVANEGKAPHQTTGKFTNVWFTEQGDRIRKVVQTTKSVPDYLLFPDEDGTIVALDETVEQSEVAVEVESKNSSKGSNTLVNIERAIARDQFVVLVYPSRKLAKRGYSHLAQTFKKYTEHGAHLYNRSGEITCPDGRVPVYEGSSNVDWYLAGKTVEGRVDGDVIASGDATADVGTVDFETYYYVQDGDVHHIETEDGELVAKYRSNDAFTAEWTRVTLPHVPMNVSYLDKAIILYHDVEADELKRYTEDAQFVDELDADATKRDHYEAGIQAYCQAHVEQRDGAELSYDRLFREVGCWFGARSTLGTPPNTEIGRALPEYLKDAQKARDNNNYKYFDGYAWRFELGLESPHRPGVDDIDPIETVDESSERESDGTGRRLTDDDMIDSTDNDGAGS